MADVSPVHLRGIEGVFGANGKISRLGVKFVVNLQPDESDEPIPYGYFATEEDAKAYVRSHKLQGYGQGLRVVKV